MAVAQLQLRLFDIMWEEVLCKHILPYFSLKELFQLRGISLEFRDLVNFYFSKVFTVDTTEYSTSFSSQAFEVLTGRNCVLKELILDNADKWLSDSILHRVVQSNPNLHTICLNNCHSISDTGVSAVGENCPNLCKLSLVNCNWVSGSGLLSFINEALLDRGLPTSFKSIPLEHLDLSGCSGLTDDDIVHLATVCKHLKYLALSMMLHITNRAVEMFARNCCGLQQLNVKGCRRLTDRCINLVGEFCPALKVLLVQHCSGITESSLAKLRKRAVYIDRAACKARRSPCLHLQI